MVGGIYLLFDRIAPSRSIPSAQAVEIVQKWELPPILSEVSGIAMMEPDRMACIQDEQGIIFVYNLRTSKIEQRIEFGDSGDYEGIALAGTTAYVLRSDGSIFEVKDYAKKAAPAIKHSTPLPGKYDFEGLCYDEQNNRLLVSIKDFDKDAFKPVFAFDLSTKQLNPDAVFRIDFNDPVFDSLNGKKCGKSLRSSEIGIQPGSGNIYVLEAKNPKLLILDPNGKPLKLYVFEQQQFRQAEGISFGEAGELYISNEGGPGPGNILRISLD